jgi:hypothetical protein
MWLPKLQRRMTKRRKMRRRNETTREISILL